jgi:glycosyltransferase involved in cell wall biosynthesis
MTLVISMPVFNEAEGIREFFDELWESFHKVGVQFIFINDCSTDGTNDVLLQIKSEFGDKIHLITNNKNMGHGISTLTGLRWASNLNTDSILTIDGDGQFYSKDVLALYNTFLLTQVDVLEGCRISRKDPFFRKISSLATKILVTMRARRIPHDANTPLRIYTKSALESVLKFIPFDSLIPNMHVSVATRKLNLNLREEKIQNIHRRGVATTGTTWGPGLKQLPSKRFLTFCYRAIQEWIHS